MDKVDIMRRKRKEEYEIDPNSSFNKLRKLQMTLKEGKNYKSLVNNLTNKIVNNETYKKYEEDKIKQIKEEEEKKANEKINFTSNKELSQI